MVSLLDIDNTSLVLVKKGLIPNSNKIDYAVIETNIGNIWYDSERDIVFSCVDSDRSECCRVGHDGQFIFEFRFWKDSRFHQEHVSITNVNCNEESFFMESTINDFGSVTFEYYKKVYNLYREVIRIIRTSEGQD
ncbi:hypothetical protein WJW27_002677 [Escherichia coli]|uniref:hypothetical protein n=1 Tax=Escherichia coli TaxID=562 RepID=UPI002376F2B0|nr:hypothetical protein vBEcoMphAPEC6_02190 [Escherichia phage ph0011]